MLSGWVIAGAAGMGLALGAAVWIQTSRLEGYIGRVETLEVEASGLRSNLKTMEEDRDRANMAEAQAIAQFSRLSGVTHEIRTEVVKVPVTVECRRSPAVRAAFGGVRRLDAGGAAPAEAGATGIVPRTMPAGAASTSR